MMSISEKELTSRASDLYRSPIKMQEFYTLCGIIETDG